VLVFFWGLTTLALSDQCPGLKLDGQVSAWALCNYDTSFGAQAGGRYLPGVSFGRAVFKDWTLDFEGQANGFATVSSRFRDSLKTDVRVKPYRLWVRLASDRFESRLGLQKINFGSATLLRPLQWFDRIDPRDPLQITDGVYALLLRYYFQNSANIWVWALAGDSTVKGWEVVPSSRWSPEMGGRAQLRVPRGEIGASYHFRRAQFGRVSQLYAPPPGPVEPVPENRFGMDGKWDVGVGLWFECVLSHTAIASESLFTPAILPWQRFLNLGLDYTFGIGNGLGVTAEHLIVSNSTGVLTSGQQVQLSALALSYPLDLVDNLRGFVFFDWKSRQFSRSLGWQRTLDRWIVYVSAFWNPNQPQGLPGATATSGFTGTGLQVMVVFNY